MTFAISVCVQWAVFLLQGTEMQPLITTLNGQRILTPEGIKELRQAIETSTIFNSHQATVRFPEGATNTIKEVACLRMKDWQTTKRWNYAADQSRLMGEIAVPRI